MLPDRKIIQLYVEVVCPPHQKKKIKAKFTTPSKYINQFMGNRTEEHIKLYQGPLLTGDLEQVWSPGASVFSHMTL